MVATTEAAEGPGTAAAAGSADITERANEIEMGNLSGKAIKHSGRSPRCYECSRMLYGCSNARKNLGSSKREEPGDTVQS